MSIFEETEQIVDERTTSKPAILGAPYDLSPENQEDQKDLENKFFHYTPDPVQQVAALVFGFERHLDTLEDNLAKMFKQMGHGDEWNRISNS